MQKTILVLVAFCFSCGGFRVSASPEGGFYEQRLSVLDLLGILDYYLPTSRLVENDQCRDAVRAFRNSLVRTELWTLEMIDSWGKIPDGFLFGNIHPIGMYEECVGIETEGRIDGVDTQFEGRHCMIYFESHNYTADDALETNSGFWRSGPAIALLLNPLPFAYGTCMPSLCTPEDLEVSLNDKFEDIDRRVITIECSGEEDDMDGFDITVLCLVILLLLLVVTGTIIDLLNIKNKAIQLLVHFSFTKNFVEIFSFGKKSPNEIPCLHGIRALTFIWILICHQYQSPLAFLANTFDAPTYQEPVLAQVFTNGWLSVDTFLCLTGIVIAYRLLPTVLENRKLNPFLVSLRRFLRLSPSIFVLAIFSATLLRYLGWGPRNYFLKAYTLEECRSYWWSDPLFVNNFLGYEDGRRARNDCLSHCWFTAVIMQLFLIIPILFYPLRKNFKFGLYWLGFVTLVSVIIPMTITIVYDFPPSPLITLTDVDLYQDYMTKFFLMPWCRAGPWSVGIWAGLVMVKKAFHVPSPKVLWIILGYLAALAIAIVMMLGLYRYNKVGDFQDYEMWVSILYGSLGRHAWGAAVSFVVLSCHFGHAKYVDAVLSWKGWRPLSRLTFCMYLVSPVLIEWWATVLYVPVYFSYFYKLFEICGTFFLSLLVGLLLSVTVEKPIVGLTNSFLAPPSNQDASDERQVKKLTVYA